MVGDQVFLVKIRNGDYVVMIGTIKAVIRRKGGGMSYRIYSYDDNKTYEVDDEYVFRSEDEAMSYVNSQVELVV